MLDVYYIESITQIRAMAEPTRWRMLGLLRLRPMTGSQLARALEIPRTRAHYHLNILREAGLVELQHEQINSGMLEKYYAAVGDQFRTDHLVDRTRLAARQSGDDSGTGQVVRDLMLAMLELARADVLLPQALTGLALAGFNWQHELLLNPDQTNALILALRDLIGQFMEVDRRNRLDADDSTLQQLRLTALLTPVAALQVESKVTGGAAYGSALPDGHAGDRQALEAQRTDHPGH
jgi:DNA-binding transcriptional ArsR family regulator